MSTLRDGADAAAIAEAADRLRAGELVAFPTETVYGLGADARREDAAARIYEAKGRPSNNPLIVHVADAAEAQRWTLGWDARAERLARAAWPGPLTLVLRRSPDIPARVAGGGDTLAVRAPRHPVAQALLVAFGGPIAAPSANRSSGISPTRAKHVLAELAGRVPLVLDGGPCEVGLESTVLSLVGAPQILRPGRFGRAELEALLGEPVAVGAAGAEVAAGALASPGLLERHYSPRTPLILAPAAALAGAPEAAVVLARTPRDRPLWRALPADPEGFGRELYAALRWADDAGAPQIWVEAPPEGEAWAAIADRLRRAAAR